MNQRETPMMRKLREAAAEKGRKNRSPSRPFRAKKPTDKEQDALAEATEAAKPLRNLALRISIHNEMRATGDPLMIEFADRLIAAEKKTLTKKRAKNSSMGHGKLSDEQVRTMLHWWLDHDIDEDRSWDDRRLVRVFEHLGSEELPLGENLLSQIRRSYTKRMLRIKNEVAAARWPSSPAWVHPQEDRRLAEEGSPWRTQK